jgi:hypothetical protein
MTVTSGFFDSVNGDRKYSSLQLSSLFDGLITDGVFSTIGQKLFVSAMTPASLHVTVGTGKAWLDHVWIFNDTDLDLVLDTGSIYYTRDDAVIIDVDHSSGYRRATIMVLKGNDGGGIPTMINIPGTHMQYPIAYIHFGVSDTTISQNDIINKVGSLDLPYVTGVASSFNTDTLFAQWQIEWENWLGTLQTEISGIDSVDFQNQLTALQNNSASTSDVIVGSNNAKWVTPKDILDSIVIPHVVPGYNGEVLKVNAANDALLTDNTWTSGDPLIQDYAINGRLTLQSGTPVPQTDQTNKTIVFFTPYNGDRLFLGKITGDVIDSLNYWKNTQLTELSYNLGFTLTGLMTTSSTTVTVSNTNKIATGMKVSGTHVPGGSTVAAILSQTTFSLSTPCVDAGGSATLTFAMPANKNFDMFVTMIQNGSNYTPYLLAECWTDDANRAFPLVMKNNVPCVIRAGSLPMIMRYVGTIRTNSNDGQTEDSDARRFVWNYYNKITRRLKSFLSASHTYTTVTLRPFNNDSATNIVAFVIGVAEDILNARCSCQCQVVSSSVASFGLMLDSLNAGIVTAISCNVVGIYAGMAGGPVGLAPLAVDLLPAAGYHYLVVGEIGTATGATMVSASIQGTLKG